MSRYSLPTVRFILRWPSERASSWFTREHRKANDTGLIEINQISPLYVNFSVPEQYLPQIKQYQARGKLSRSVAAPG
jgi:hypothetical protein